MKVLHILTGLKLSFLGGVSTYVRSLIDIQKKHGYDVWVLSEDENNNGLHIIKNKVTGFPPFTLCSMIDTSGEKYIADIISKYNFDIIHIHSSFLLPWGVCDILKKYNYVVSLHDYFYLCQYNAVMVDKLGKTCTSYDNFHCSKCIGLLDQIVESNWFLRKIRSFFKHHFGIDICVYLPHINQKVTLDRYMEFKKLLENANKLLPVSYKTKDIYEKSGIKNDYQVVHIGNNSANMYTMKYNKSPVNGDNKIHIAFLGELCYMKGSKIFLEILDNLKREDIEFHFFGKMSQKIEKKYSKKFINHGTYQHDQLQDICKSIDIGLVLPICEDAGPQVVMELLNNHIPIIATSMGGIPDFVQHKVNGYLFNPFDNQEKNEMIKYINELKSEDINLLRKNIKRTTTNEEHFWELDNVYKNVLL